MIDIAEVITASEGFWDSTINWYNITPIILFISVPIMFVIFLFGMMAFVDNDKRERVICAGICIIGVVVIDLDDDVIVDPALEPDELAERIITLAKW